MNFVCVVSNNYEILLMTLALSNVFIALGCFFYKNDYFVNILVFFTLIANSSMLLFVPNKKYFDEGCALTIKIGD